MSCREFEASKDDVELDEMARALAKSKYWKTCPKCKFYVEKTSGCQHITCRFGFGDSFPISSVLSICI